jgi:hypothetical protein
VNCKMVGHGQVEARTTMHNHTFSKMGWTLRPRISVAAVLAVTKLPITTHQADHTAASPAR